MESIESRVSLKVSILVRVASCGLNVSIRHLVSVVEAGARRLGLCNAANFDELLATWALDHLLVVHLVHDVWNHTVVHGVPLLRRESLRVQIRSLRGLSWSKTLELVSGLDVSGSPAVAARGAGRHSQRGRVLSDVIYVHLMLIALGCRVVRAVWIPNGLSELRRTELLPPKIHINRLVLLMSDIVRFELWPSHIHYVLIAYHATHRLVGTD